MCAYAGLVARNLKTSVSCVLLKSACAKIRKTIALLDITSYILYNILRLRLIPDLADIFSNIAITTIIMLVTTLLEIIDLNVATQPIKDLTLQNHYSLSHISSGLPLYMCLVSFLCGCLYVATVCVCVCVCMCVCLCVCVSALSLLLSSGTVWCDMDSI